MGIEPAGGHVTARTTVAEFMHRSRLCDCGSVLTLP